MWQDTALFTFCPAFTIPTFGCVSTTYNKTHIRVRLHSVFSNPRDNVLDNIAAVSYIAESIIVRWIKCIELEGLLF